MEIAEVDVRRTFEISLTVDELLLLKAALDFATDDDDFSEENEGATDLCREVADFIEEEGLE